MLKSINKKDIIESVGQAMANRRERSVDSCMKECEEMILEESNILYRKCIDILNEATHPDVQGMLLANLVIQYCKSSDQSPKMFDIFIVMLSKYRKEL